MMRKLFENMGLGNLRESFRLVLLLGFAGVMAGLLYCWCFPRGEAYYAILEIGQIQPLPEPAQNDKPLPTPKLLASFRQVSVLLQAPSQNITDNAGYLASVRPLRGVPNWIKLIAVALTQERARTYLLKRLDSLRTKYAPVLERASKEHEQALKEISVPEAALEKLSASQNLSKNIRSPQDLVLDGFAKTAFVQNLTQIRAEKRWLQSLFSDTNQYNFRFISSGPARVPVLMTSNLPVVLGFVLAGLLLGLLIVWCQNRKGVSSRLLAEVRS